MANRRTVDKGYIQLAQRSGQYRFLNADVVYEGETAAYNRITGTLEITGQATSDNAIGYFAYFQLLNGFEKAVYWTKEKVTAHAQRYSKAWKDGPWRSNFDAMALKTVVRNLISKYGVMSVEFANAVASDNGDDAIEAEIIENANMTPVEFPATPKTIEAQEEPTQPDATDAPELSPDAGF